MDISNFVRMEKVGDNFTGLYNGIYKTQNLFWLILKSQYNILHAVSISEGLKRILKIANENKDLIAGVEIKIDLISVITLKNREDQIYKKYRLTFGNGHVYEEESFKELSQNEISSFLN